jgi:hypothetical protein
LLLRTALATVYVANCHDETVPSANNFGLPLIRLDQLTPTPIEPMMGQVVLLTKRLCAGSVQDN